MDMTNKPRLPNTADETHSPESKTLRFGRLFGYQDGGIACIFNQTVRELEVARLFSDSYSIVYIEYYYIADYNVAGSVNYQPVETLVYSDVADMAIATAEFQTDARCRQKQVFNRKSMRNSFDCGVLCISPDCTQVRKLDRRAPGVLCPIFTCLLAAQQEGHTLSLARVNQGGNAITRERLPLPHENSAINAILAGWNMNAARDAIGPLLRGKCGPVESCSAIGHPSVARTK